MEPEQKTVAIFRGKDLTDKEKIEELLTAAGNNDVKRLTELITLGNYKPLLNQLNFNGWTALQYASRYGHRDSAQVLLEAKALPDVTQEDGYTALMSASQWGHTEIVKLLLEAGAEIDFQDQDGRTAAMLAKTEEIREMILTAPSTSDGCPLSPPDSATVLSPLRPPDTPSVIPPLTPSDSKLVIPDLPTLARISTLKEGKVREWSVEAVIDWLQTKNLQEFEEKFRKHKITGNLLLSLDEMRLGELGIPILYGQKIIDEIQPLKHEER